MLYVIFSNNSLNSYSSDYCSCARYRSVSEGRARPGLVNTSEPISQMAPSEPAMWPSPFRVRVRVRICVALAIHDVCDVSRSGCVTSDVQGLCDVSQLYWRILNVRRTTNITCTLLFSFCFVIFTKLIVSIFKTM